MNSVPKLATLMLVLLLIASTVQKEPLKQDEGKSVDPKQNPSGKSTNITIGGGSGIPGLTLTIGKDSKGEAPKQAPSASSNTPGSNGVKPAQVIVVTSSNHDPNKKPVTPQDHSHDLKSSPSGSAPTLKIVVGSGNSGQPSSDTPKGNAAPPVQSGNIGSNGGNSKISVVIVSPGQTGGSVNGASSRMASVPVSAVSTTVTPATGGNDVTIKESKKDKAPLDLPTTDHEKEKWKHDCEQNITEWSATVKKILDYRKAALKSNIPENPDKVKNDTNTLQQIVNWCWLGRRIARKLGAADLGSRLFTIIFLANGDTYEK